MKIDKAEVKTREKSLGIVEVPVLETEEDLLNKITQEGWAVVAELVNAQVKQRVMNEFRAREGGKPPKSAFQKQALGLITKEEMENLLGNAAGIDALIKSKAAELEAQWMAEHKNLIPEDDSDEK